MSVNMKIHANAHYAQPLSLIHKQAFRSNKNLETHCLNPLFQPTTLNTFLHLSSRARKILYTLARFATCHFFPDLRGQNL